MRYLPVSTPRPSGDHGSTPTPDQNDVDAIGRAYGLQEEDTGRLQSAGEVLARRDRHRSELRAPSRHKR